MLVSSSLAFAVSSAPLELPYGSAFPFFMLLLAIAILPVTAGRWWHSNRNKTIVAAAFGLPVAFYLIYVNQTTGQDTLHPLVHEIKNYASFIILLGSFYIVSGGIVVLADFRPTPLTNTLFLTTGALLANVIGTTGSSVLLIRPFLRINQQRLHTRHLPIFFIFTVSNLGGLLTPLGDPPLFLGFLNGVPFSWTLWLWPEWLVANGVILAVFFIWDHIAYRRQTPSDLLAGKDTRQSLRLEGLMNLPLLAGIIGGVLVQGLMAPPWGEWTGMAIMLMLGLLSLASTPRRYREANDFSWAPILEVAILFAGIFVAMVPALELLGAHGQELGISRPWQYFWLTGGLSAFLDNAPTYLSFATMAAGSTDFNKLVLDQVAGLNGPLTLKAISCGAVFMGAMSYIGNGPNFMVKAIADQAGFKTPSFFGYILYASLILLPALILISLVFFPH